MKITCEKCGHINTVNTGGRKNYAIPFTMVCKGLRWHSKGGIHLTNTAIEIKRLTGITVTPAFVSMRIRREAASKLMTTEELLAKYVPKGKGG